MQQTYSCWNMGDPQNVIQTGIELDLNVPSCPCVKWLHVLFATIDKELYATIYVCVLLWILIVASLLYKLFHLIYIIRVWLNVIIAWYNENGGQVAKSLASAPEATGSNLAWSRDTFILGWWCSGRYSDLPCRRSGVRFPYLPILEKCAKGICLCNLLQSTQPNDQETVIEGWMRRVSVNRI